MSKKGQKKIPKKARGSEPDAPPESEMGDAASGGESSSHDGDAAGMVRTHLRFGWWSLLVFLSVGIFLEALHGFKAGWYLDLGDPETRRLMWTLAHAHGVLLSLVHLGFAFTLKTFPPGRPGRSLRTASVGLMVAALLIPGGFFLGGVWIYGGDPGLGILLVPVGAICLFAAVFITAKAAGRS